MQHEEHKTQQIKQRVQDADTGHLHRNPGWKVQTDGQPGYDHRQFWVFGAVTMCGLHCIAKAGMLLQIAG